MTELKYGDSDVKIMYGSQEIGGATKLEPGTIIYTAVLSSGHALKEVHLFSTTKNWSNIDGINVKILTKDSTFEYLNINITGDGFKNLNKAKTYKTKNIETITVSRSTVDGEYRLNISAGTVDYRFEIRAL